MHAEEAARKLLRKQGLKTTKRNKIGFPTVFFFLADEIFVAPNPLIQRDSFIKEMEHIRLVIIENLHFQDEEKTSDQWQGRCF